MMDLETEMEEEEEVRWRVLVIRFPQGTLARSTKAAFVAQEVRDRLRKGDEEEEATTRGRRWLADLRAVAMLTGDRDPGSARTNERAKPRAGLTNTRVAIGQGQDHEDVHVPGNEGEVGAETGVETGTDIAMAIRVVTHEAHPTRRINRTIPTAISLSSNNGCDNNSSSNNSSNNKELFKPLLNQTLLKTMEVSWRCSKKCRNKCNLHRPNQRE